MLLLAFSALPAADKTIQLKDLPVAVQGTVQTEESKGARIVRLATEQEGGKTMYEVETTIGGYTRDLLVNAKGQIVEIEEEIGVDSVPPAVKSALETRGAVGRIERVTKGTTVTYEATVDKNGRRREIALNASGKPLRP